MFLSRLVLSIAAIAGFSGCQGLFQEFEIPQGMIQKTASPRGSIWVDEIQYSQMPTAIELTPQESVYVKLLHQADVDIVFLTKYHEWQEFLRRNGIPSTANGIAGITREGRNRIVVYVGDQARAPLHVVLSHESVHIKQQRQGKHIRQYSRIREALQKAGDQSGLKILENIEYELKYRYRLKDGILHDWRIGGISRDEAVDQLEKVQRNRGIDNSERIRWLRTEASEQEIQELFQSYGMPIEEIADEFFAHMYDQLILTSSGREKLIKTISTKELHRLLEQFINHIDGSAERAGVLKMVKEYYEGLGMPDPVLLRDSFERKGSSGAAVESDGSRISSSGSCSTTHLWMKSLLCIVSGSPGAKVMRRMNSQPIEDLRISCMSFHKRRIARM